MINKKMLFSYLIFKKSNRQRSTKWQTTFLVSSIRHCKIVRSKKEDTWDTVLDSYGRFSVILNFSRKISDQTFRK